MVSHKMSAVEAWVLNTINATLCQFDLGCQIFTPNDELVDIESAELFYWVVKKIHLSNLAKFYENEYKHIPPSNSCLQATIMRLSKYVCLLTSLLLLKSAGFRIIAEDIEVSNQNSSAFLNGKHVD